MNRNKPCKICSQTEFALYPNKICQKCASLAYEEYLRNQGKKVLLSAESLIEDYLVDHKSIRQISRETGLSSFKVRSYLNEYNIPIRSTANANTKYVNKDIFKQLTPSSAYLLGYIFTDGDLLLNEKTGLHFLRIYSKFRYKIEGIKKIMSAEAKIQHRKAQSHKGRNQSEIFFIHVGNQDVIKDLIDFGMVLNKNEEIQFPEIPEHLISHFIRGAWSGSGSVSTYKNALLSSFVNGSIDFITELERRLNAIGLPKRTIHKAKHSKKPSYSFKYATNDSELLYWYMYNGVTDETTCRRQEKLYKEYFGEVDLRMLQFYKNLNTY